MPLLQLSQLSLAYGHVPLARSRRSRVEPGERIGLNREERLRQVSLLKIIEGLAAADRQGLARAQLSSASVSQSLRSKSGQSVFEAVAEGLGKGTKLLSIITQRRMRSPAWTFTPLRTMSR